MLAATILGAGLVAVLLWAERARPDLRPLAKLGGSAGFLVVALIAGAVESPYGRWVFVALLLSALGDAALLSRATAPFLMGLGAFLVGHLAYSAAFLVRGVSWVVVAGSIVGLAIPATVVLRWLWPRVSTRMQAPVVAYAVVITLMVAAAVGTAGSEASSAIPIAAVGFYLSDLAVARDRFVAPGFVNKLWGLPLYYAAQYVFAWTV